MEPWCVASGTGDPFASRSSGRRENAAHRSHASRKHAPHRRTWSSRPLWFGTSPEAPSRGTRPLTRTRTSAAMDRASFRREPAAVGLQTRLALKAGTGRIILDEPQDAGKTWRNSREPRMSAGRSGLPSDGGGWPSLPALVGVNVLDARCAARAPRCPGRRPVSLGCRRRWSASGKDRSPLGRERRK